MFLKMYLIGSKKSFTCNNNIIYNILILLAFFSKIGKRITMQFLKYQNGEV